MLGGLAPPPNPPLKSEIGEPCLVGNTKGDSHPLLLDTIILAFLGALIAR